jgi:hypothetical protein
MSYSGPHAICHQTIDRQHAEFNAALNEARRVTDANQLIAGHIRWLLQPGVKRKIIRLDELRAIVDRAERATHNPEDVA